MRDEHCTAAAEPALKRLGAFLEALDEHAVAIRVIDPVIVAASGDVRLSSFPDPHPTRRHTLPEMWRRKPTSVGGREREGPCRCLPL